MVERLEQFAGSISCIYHYIQKIERVEMAKYGLKDPHTQYLLALCRCPEGLTAAQLCRICDKDKAAVSRALTELEREGLVARTSSHSYRCPVILTEKGREASSQVELKARRAVEAAGQGLKEENRQIFYETLDLFASNLRKLLDEGISEE